MVVPTTFARDVLANSSLHLSPTHYPQSPHTYHVHSDFTPNTRINPNVIQNDEHEGDDDCEEEWVGELVLPTCVLMTDLLKKHKTLKFGMRDVLKFN